MSVEKQVEKRMGEYADIAKKNKNVDVGALMVNALAQAQREEMDAKKKKQAYWISVIVPPAGLFIAAYYYFFSDTQGAKEVARNCLILTVIVLVVAYLVGEFVLASIPANTTAALQNVNITELPAQYKELMQ
jgi:flagellar basal body-associated protein FliL